MNHRLGAQTTEFWEREQVRGTVGWEDQGAGSGPGVPEKGQSIRRGGREQLGRGLEARFPEEPLYRTPLHH